MPWGSAILTFTGHESLGALYAANALLAAATAFDNPARQALIPRLVPTAELPAALSLNLTMFHAAFIGGPALAGLLIAGALVPHAGLAAPRRRCGRDRTPPGSPSSTR